MAAVVQPILAYFVLQNLCIDPTAPAGQCLYAIQRFVFFLIWAGANNGIEDVADDTVGNSINICCHHFVLCWFIDTLLQWWSQIQQFWQWNWWKQCVTHFRILWRERLDCTVTCHVSHTYIFVFFFCFLLYLTCLRKSIVVRPYKWYLSMFGLHMDSFESGSVKLSSIHCFYTYVSVYTFASHTII